jgi:acetolactate synthase-1/2/3 large subunit
MTGADALAECLKAEGVEVAFGLRGLHVTPAIVAVKKRGIRFIEVRHEQSAAFMADAYARATGNVGVVISGTGAGTACTMVGLQEAYGSSCPVLLIASQIPETTLGKGWGDLHEVKSQHGLISSVVETCYDVASPADIPVRMAELFQRMRNERPRPCGLEVSDTVLKGDSGRAFSYQPAVRTPRTPDPEAIRRAIDAVSKAERPVIYCGGGAIASGASKAVQGLAELLNAPVLTSVKGKGVVSETHELSLGNLGTEAPVRALLGRADIAVVIGTRFGNRSTGNWSLRLPARWVRIDIDEAQFAKTHPDIQAADVIALVGDARTTVERMLGGLKATAIRHRGFAKTEVIRTKQQTLEELRRRYPAEMQLLGDLRKALRSDAIVANDSTVATYWTRRYFEVHEPRTFLWAMGTGTIGFGLPAAIGAKVAESEHQVIALCGDGGFLFSCHELATAIRYGLAIVVLLFNDQAYGIVDYAQRKAGSLEGDERLANPDFVALARSFGADATRVDALSDVGAALAEALSRARTVVIEVPVALRVPPDLA